MTEPYMPPQGPPQGPPPDPAIFAALGLEGITRMVEDQYRNLGASPIAHLFPQGEAALLAAARKNALFFAQVCGGPPLFSQQVGPPRMRARHLPFAITPGARDTWLACWQPVLDRAVTDYGFPAEHLPGFSRFLTEFSAWMVNQAPEPGV